MSRYLPFCIGAPLRYIVCRERVGETVARTGPQANRLESVERFHIPGGYFQRQLPDMSRGSMADILCVYYALVHISWIIQLTSNIQNSAEVKPGELKLDNAREARLKHLQETST